MPDVLILVLVLLINPHVSQCDPLPDLVHQQVEGCHIPDASHPPLVLLLQTIMPSSPGHP